MIERSVLLTGASGFIGRHMAAYLAAQGCHVTSLQRTSETIAGVRDLIVIPDLSPRTVTDGLSGRRFEWLVHLAAYGVHPDHRDAQLMFSINVHLVQVLVALASRWPARAVFLAGSGSEYDTRNACTPVHEEHPIETRSLYGASKAAGGISAVAQAHASALPLAVGRIFGVYGSGESPHRLLPSLVGSLKSGRRVPLSPGDQLRDQLYVRDVVDAIARLVRAVEANCIQVIANIASGEPISVRAFAEAVADELGVSRAFLGFGDLSRRPDETMCFSGSPARLKSLTQWMPAFDLRAGIREAVGAPLTGLATDPSCNAIVSH